MVLSHSHIQVDVRNPADTGMGAAEIEISLGVLTEAFPLPIGHEIVSIKEVRRGDMSAWITIEGPGLPLRNPNGSAVRCMCTCHTTVETLGLKFTPLPKEPDR